MQIDQRDLKREFKERCVRKMPYFDRNLMKNSLIDFSEYTKSTTRREMPNKYNIPKVPKIQIEQVYHQNLLRKSKSISGGIPSAPMTPIQAPSTSQKPFYYISNNEIMSVEEFLEVHKAMEGYRKKQDKAAFHQTMIEKRMKIEEAYSDRGSSCNTARRPSDAFLSSSGRPISTQISRKISGSQLMTPAAARSPRENIVFEPTSFVPATPKTPKNASDLTNKSRKLRKGLSLKTGLELNMVAVDDTISTLRETTRIQPSSARGFTTNQKFTEKEIARHLFRGTVSPRPPRYGGKGVEKEKSYIRMFRDPKTMDLAVEATIRKATRLVTNEGQKSTRSREQSPDRKDIEQFQTEEIQLDNPPNFRNSAKKSDTPIVPFSPRENIENEQPIVVEKMIRTSIKNINLALNSTTPRLLAGIFGDNDGSKTEKNKGKTTKVILRSEVEQKYNFSKHLEQNRRLSYQMKEITKALRKELPKSSISNQNYIEHFTY